MQGDSYKHATDVMARVGDEPNVSALTEELRRSATDYGVYARVENVENVRFCRWPGASAFTSWLPGRRCSRAWCWQCFWRLWLAK